MKKSKIIIPALAMLVMSTAATVTGTVAWFTMNKTATAEGMVVSAKTSGSLIIKDVTAAVSVPSAADKATKVVFDATPHAFYPSTHGFSYTNPDDNDANTNEQVSSSTGLMYVTNGASVNFETGTARAQDAPLVYGAVVAPGVNETNAYYQDYNFFLAGDGMEMPNQAITITLSNAQDLTINGALSIDFYGEEVTSAQRAQVSDANYKGTLNLAKKYNVSKGVSGDKASITIGDTTNHAGVLIPKVGATNGDTETTDPAVKAYAITMRVYYDGALIDEGVANNDYATYTKLTTGQATGNEAYLFYSDGSGSSVVSVKQNDQLANLYIVDTEHSTTTFARSIEVAHIEQKTLNVSITAVEA